MLSRVANSVFWMSRYIERAENVARFLDVNFNLTLGEGEGLSRQWAPLIYTTGDHQLFEKLYGPANRDNVLAFLAFDQRNPNSILSCVTQARENARGVREVIPGAIWEQINKFYLMVSSAAKAVHSPNHQTNEFCDAVKLYSNTIVGLIYATMSQGEPWHFGRIGRLIERADKTSRIVDVQYFLLLPEPQDVGSSLDILRWSALLKSASALEMYRRIHGRIAPERVAHFLILDRQFPRSMHFCLLNVQQSLHEITGSVAGTFANRSEQLVGRLGAELDYTTVNDIVQGGMHEFIDSFQRRLNALGEAIHRDFFTIAERPATPQPHLNSTASPRQAQGQAQGQAGTQPPSGP